MLSDRDVAQAAKHLCRHRLAPTRSDPLPHALRPGDEGEGYAIQRALLTQLQRAGLGGPAGYKIGCTTEVMQRFLSIDHPCAGRMTEGRVFYGDTKLPFEDFARVGVECELAVRIAAPIADRTDRNALIEAIAEFRTSIEIVDDRYSDYSALDASTLIADDFFHSGCVLGASGEPTLDSLDEIAARMSINGQCVGEGIGGDILGHPLNALAWLDAHCTNQGASLAAGDWVTLGSMVQTQWLEPGARVEICVSGLGPVRLTVE